eukprot:TRINITY_DN23200_c0_g1_i1.p1 TRINITY_DN23200_c0_g1~~TRINITY_DN23200_c0_g1_i1.p1  ORF type:complete len:993 (-),score=402.69 TRINITY_DN23200_c0_g1_i1:268-3246(-)
MEDVVAVEELSMRDRLCNLFKNRGMDELEKLGGIEQIMRDIRTDPDQGLSAEEAATRFAERKAQFGTNVHKERERKGILRLLYEAWKDEMLMLLTVLAIIALVLGVAFPEGGDRTTGWVDGFGILMAVVIVTVVTAVQEWNQDREFRRLYQANAIEMVDVVRGGEAHAIPNTELLVGDILRINSGAQIQADGILLLCDSVETEESAMTGEDRAVKKSLTRDPFLIASTTVQNGSGVMVVLAVGEYSQWGSIMDKVQEDTEDTPLQKKLHQLAINIGYIGMAVATLVFIVLMFYWVLDIIIDGDGWYWARLIHILEYFIIAVTIVAVAVPEGLPLAVMIALSYSVRQMMKDNNFVRHLQGCETMGGATVICSDKTGTLTEGRMTVARGWVAGSRFDDGAPESISEPVKRNLCDGLCVNTVLTSYVEVDESAPDAKPIYHGSATECALLLMSNKLGEEYMGLREELVSKTKKTIPFNSTRKRMSTVIERDGRFTMFTKGASELVLERCTLAMNPDGSTSPLSDALRQELDQLILDMANQGYRTLSLATRDFEVFDTEEDEYHPAEGEPDAQDLADREGALEQKLTLVAVVGIEDRLRAEVPEAVKTVHGAGVRVIMITGDKLETARKIARDCNVLDENDSNSVEGPVFRKMTLEQQMELLRTLQVMARSSPDDKSQLVHVLKGHMFQLVAVTGDGTNDAKALKEAHIGLAMGSGTRVAKVASEIVIQDDSFKSVVAAVKWGRCIFDNIRKFLQFQLCVNIAALCVAFIGAVTRAGTPLKAIQLLWVNLIMDSMGALALATEKPTDSLLQRPPINIRHPKTRLLSNRMWVNFMGQSLYQVGILCLLLFWAPFVLPDIPPRTDAHYTMIFNAFVFCQIFNEVNARKVNGELNIFEGIWTNYMFIAIIVITVVLQFLIVQFGGIIFKTTGLNAWQWAVTVAIGAISWPLGLALRCLPIPPDDNHNGLPTPGDSVQDWEKPCENCMLENNPAAKKNSS